MPWVENQQRAKKLGYIGMAFDSLPTAEKRGYDFVGWFTEKQGGTQLLVNQPITQSTYYAQYTEHNYNLVLKANGPKIRRILQKH